MKTKLSYGIWICVAFLLLAACFHKGHIVAPSDTMVLRYQDFAPQAAAYEVIGFEYYQWNSQGPDNPLQHDDVQVVVYRGISLDQAKQMYPVVRRYRDYRYLSYDRALDYCDRLMRESGDLVEHLQQTRKRIHEHLDPPNA